MSGHCGQKLQCPSECACGDAVRDEQAQGGTSAALCVRVGENAGRVDSGAIRALLGPQIERGAM